MPAVLAALDRLRRESVQSGTRAAVVNLVVLAAVDAAADRVVHSVTGLGVHHPGRTTVIVADPDGSSRPPTDTTFGARIELRSGHDGGVSDPLWWEVVVLHVRGEVCRHLDSVVEPLLMHDLPVVLWLAGGTSRVDSDRLVSAANQVIVSGERAAAGRTSDLESLAADLADLGGRRPVSDLAWIALTPGRLALARLFDTQVPAGPAVEAVEISGPPWSSRLLAAWLVERGVVDRDVVRLATPGPAEAGHLRATLDVAGRPARLDAGSVWPAGAGGPAGGDAAASSVAEARIGDARVAVPHQGADTPRLLATALTHAGRDARYEAALAVAAGWRR